MKYGKLFIPKTNICILYKNGIYAGFKIDTTDVVLSLSSVDSTYFILQPVLTKHGVGYVYSGTFHQHLKRIDDVENTTQW